MVLFLKNKKQDQFTHQRYIFLSRMDFFSNLTSPWGKMSSFDDPIVNLSNKKNKQGGFAQGKQSKMDRYIAQSVQKCLFKDKFQFQQQNTSKVQEVQKQSGKKEKMQNYQNILQNSLKKHKDKKLISSMGSYSSKLKYQREGFILNMNDSYPQHKPVEHHQRIFPKSPYKILDAPRLKDDFYTNLLDWSKQDIISVVLDNAAYIWSAKGNQAEKLIQGYISSVKWGKGLLIGEQTGRIRMIDVEKKVQFHRYKQHFGRVGCIDVNSNTNLVASGSKDSDVLVWDIRSNSLAHRFNGHKQQICGLKWSADNNHLASGGNDNLVFVWQPRMNKALGKLSQHTAAVKALAWSPHKTSLLATGGGSTDKTIKLWDVNDMYCTKTIDTGSQVCNMTFSNTTDQLVSTHGYSLNSIVVWKTKTMEKLTTLNGHTFRVLYLAKSPDDETIMTGSGDQTLRFWKLFPSEKNHHQSTGKLQMKNFIIR